MDDIINKIKEVSANYFLTSVKEIDSNCRKREIVDARKSIAYIIDKYYKDNFDQYVIGKAIGNKDRSTASLTVKKAKDIYNTDKVFRYRINQVEQALCLLSSNRKIVLFKDNKDQILKAMLENKTIIELDELSKTELINIINKIANGHSFDRWFIG